MRRAIVPLITLAIASVAWFGAGYAWASHHLPVQIRQVDDITSYNDGFLDGKSECR